MNVTKVCCKFLHTRVIPYPLKRSSRQAPSAKEPRLEGGNVCAPQHV
ncbi:hypothetical protein PAMC26577_23630 [Caballeronia sordidicola]|uniref:Uncharacterized protein n=1 Tax=Caballeronia sordidicola TaxID=196367 RepID=A0A242ML15_CABSO|nr:hypothetical protein PAMC26577_23630 [Caballeronia sordidicola]